MSLDKSYIPHANINYPEFTDGHIRPINDAQEMAFDKNYPYVNYSKKAKRSRRLARFLLRTMIFPMSYIKLGLKIRGKENLKKNKKLLKEGAISISNHINMWDYIAIMNAIKPFKPWVLVLKENVASKKDGKSVRMVGGIPIPENDYEASVAQLRAVKKLINDGGWLHIYPEGSMWEHYRYIRPFKKGTASIAKMVNKPVVPIAFSYRKPGWIRRKIFHQVALLNLCVGEPIFVNKELPSMEQENDLLKRCHDAVVDLAGLTNEDNRYEAIYKNSKRIDF